MKCIACLCNNCKMIRAKLQGDTRVNLVQDDIIINLCDTFAVNNTHRGEQVMILDPGVPMSLAARLWLDQYLKEFDLTIDNMVSSSCNQVFYSVYSVWVHTNSDIKKFAACRVKPYKLIP